MKTTDLFKVNRSARRINESMEKIFGKKINLENFSLEQLQDTRNKLRTQLSQQRAASGFNENIENEAYSKAQWMLDAINAEITQREEYIVDSVEVSVNEGEIHDEADHWTKEFIKMGMDPKEAEDKAWDLLWRRLKRERGIDDEDEDEFRENQQRNTTMKKIYEGEIDQASAIVTANTMVDRLGRWIEELSGMENETLLELGDSIRDEMGQEQSRQFIETVAPVIQTALDNLKSARESVSGAVRSLATGESPDAMLGAPEEPEMGGDMGDLDMSDPDAMNAGDIEVGPEDPVDDFDAAEPASGGIEAAGRAKRESIDFQNRLLKVLAG